MSDESAAESTASAIRAALAKLNRRLRAQDESPGVGPTGLSLLARLLRDGPSTATVLATQERLQPQSLTRTLRVLEDDGLIVRSTDPEDRRRSTIRLTDSGLELLRQSARKRESWLAQAMLATLSATERDLLRLAVSLLDRLADAEP